ncbi:MAG TPA: HDOD domain-containing protein [Gammaproteobacteria bacterium]|nr:HDOD domain-containing protein [Gammaproteobacteria bacterium]
MNQQAAQQTEMFAFVQRLATQLSADDIELPSFPDVVIRLRQLLDDERSTTAQIVQLLAAEPALAARLLQIANSAALRGSGGDVTNLNMAVTRLGRNMVRNSAVSYAVKQLREAQKLEAAQVYLEEIWDESTHVAALCYVLARRFTRLNADEALLVGLVHAIGKLYILGQAQSYPELFADEADLRETLQEWHAPIGSAILQNWNFSEAVSSSVAAHRQVDRDHEGPPDLTDILIVAHLLATFLRAESDAELQLGEVPASRHLNLSAHDFHPVLAEMEEHVSSLRRALSR